MKYAILLYILQIEYGRVFKYYQNVKVLFKNNKFWFLDFEH